MAWTMLENKKTVQSASRTASLKVVWHLTIFILCGIMFNLFMMFIEKEQWCIQ